MLTVYNFCVALCKLSSVLLSVQSAHMAIGSNNNAGLCRSLVFLYLYSQPGTFLPRRTTEVSSVSQIGNNLTLCGVRYNERQTFATGVQCKI